MTDSGNVTVRTARVGAGSLRRGIAPCVVSLLALVCLVNAADARMTIRRQAPYDNLFFHGSYFGDPFDPGDDFTLEVWNCANGALPIFVADAKPLIVCGYDEQNAAILADLVYSAEVPAGWCVDHGRSCYYRNRDVPSAGPGVRYFRVRYARPGRGNRVWLDSYGDLSSANQANMLTMIKLNGLSEAIRADTFTPIASGAGGWFHP
jgi:hypothetical protein